MGLDSISITFLDNVSISFIGARKPVFPWVITSGIPPAFVDITGTLHAKASYTASGRPSVIEVSKSISNSGSKSITFLKPVKNKSFSRSISCVYLIKLSFNRPSPITKNFISKSILSLALISALIFLAVFIKV